MIEFKQKRRLQSRNFKLYDDRIVVETITLHKNRKYELKLDRLGHEILYESDSVLLGKIFLYVCLAIPPVLLLLKLTGLSSDIEYSVIGVNFILWYFLALINVLKPHQDDIIIVGGQSNLSFYRHIPNESAVLEFVNLVISASKKYLKDKLTRLDTSIPEEIFVNRLIWLKDQEILTESEFVKLKDEYKFKKLI
jgi:hypothetical protein